MEFDKNAEAEGKPKPIPNSSKGDTAEPAAVGNTVEQKVVILSCVKRFIEIAFV